MILLCCFAVPDISRVVPHQAQLHRLGGVDWAHVNTADALMSFSPDSSWDPATMQTKIKVYFIFSSMNEFLV
jgi:hypothetical protein